MKDVDVMLAKALELYRKKFPKGAIPEEIEERLMINSYPSKPKYKVSLDYWVSEESNAKCFFAVEVDWETHVPTVVHSEDIDVLLNAKFRTIGRDIGLDCD